MTCNGRMSSFWNIFQVIILFMMVSKTSGGCPKACFCNTISRIVYCSRRGLSAIPDGLPRDSIQVNLNGNIFMTPSLQRSNFSRFIDLEHLYLSECGLEEISVDTFIDLVNLKWLDLSNNRLKVITEFTFRGLNLQHLFLNGNRNIKLTAGSFDQMDTTGLYLHDCSLQKLSVEVLSPLNMTLRYLWLNGNEMERFGKEFLPLFSTLSHLRLGSNPLHCNCESMWLKEFYDKNEDIFKGAVPPSCLTPSRLRGKYFNVIPIASFRCQAPVFNNIDAVFDTNEGKLRCTATGDPAPLIFWIKPSGESNTFTPAMGEDIRTNEGILKITNVDKAADEVNGLYLCLANNEAGNVTLTLNVSLPPAPPPMKQEIRYVEATRSPHYGHTTPTTTGQKSQIPKDNRVVVNKDNKLKGYNFTALNMMNYNRRRGERLFNLTELVGAVIGTHVCTLILCLIFMPIYLKRQWKRRHHDELEKSPNEAMYLNGLNRHVDYLDSPAQALKR